MATSVVLVVMALGACGGDDVAQTPVTTEPRGAAGTPPPTFPAPTTTVAAGPPPSIAAVPLTTSATQAPPQPPAVPPAPPVTVPLAFDDAWVLEPVPDGFVAVRADDLPEWREIGYQRVDAQHDTSDAPIVIRVGGEQQSERYLQEASPVVIQGRDGWSGRLQSDGSLYGTAVVWPVGEGLWVRVEWREPDVSLEQVVGIAEDAVPVDALEWERLTRALSSDSHVGRIDPEAAEVVAIEGEAGAIPHRLIVLIPSDYPLGPDDRRRSCFQLEVDGQRQPARCDDQPRLERVGDRGFVYGRARGDAPVSIRRTSADGEGPPEPAAIAQPDGSPSALFLAVVPADWCAVLIDGALGPGAATLPGDPFHAECIAQEEAG